MSAATSPMDDALTSEWHRILADHWPDLYAKLGARITDYLVAARRNAAVHMMMHDAAVARYVNLCCALGPNFENRPENEWAMAILADERLEEWVKLHQLVVRSATALGRQPHAGHQLAAQLLRADAALLNFHDEQSKALNSDARLLARVACDLEAVDIRVLETDWRREYKLVSGVWQWVAYPPKATSLRLGAGRPPPTMISVLTQVPKSASLARLQVRLLTHACCSQDTHPLVSFAGVHGLNLWRGHLAQSVSWQVTAPEADAVKPGMGAALLAESLPETSLLRTSCCGVRDEGVPIGSLEIYVWAYAADQYLWALKREKGETLHWPLSPQASALPATGSMQCRLERNGAALVSTGWTQGFQVDLHKSLLHGLNKLFEAWQQVATNATMRSAIDLLVGQGVLAWGRREASDSLTVAPLLRVAGELDLNNLIDLELIGDVDISNTRSRVRLGVKGASPLKQVLERVAAEPSLMEVMLGVCARWQLNFQLEFDPHAMDNAAMWCDAGPCRGFLMGEVGLRPRLSGGSGWQWYVRMHTEPVNVTLRVHDPVLGQTCKTLPLLPGIDLLDWSLG